MLLQFEKKSTGIEAGRTGQPGGTGGPVGPPARWAATSNVEEGVERIEEGPRGGRLLS